MPDWESVNEFVEGATVVFRIVEETLLCIGLVLLMIALI